MSLIPTLSVPLLLPTIMLLSRPLSACRHCVASQLISPLLTYSVPYDQINLSGILLSDVIAQLITLCVAPLYPMSHLQNVLPGILILHPQAPVVSLHPFSPQGEVIPPRDTTPRPGLLLPLCSALRLSYSAGAEGSRRLCTLLWPALPSSAISPPYSRLFYGPYYPGTFSQQLRIEQMLDELITYVSRTLPFSLLIAPAEVHF